MHFLPGFFILEKRHLGAAVQNGSAKNFEMNFFEYLAEKLSTKFFSVICYSVLRQRNRTWTPKIHCFLRWMNLGLRWISHPWNITATNSENRMIRILLEIQQSLFQIFRSSLFKWTTQKFFFQNKIPGRSHKTFLCFRNGQKLVRTW